MSYSKKIVLVGIGGAIGTLLRYSIYTYLTLQNIGITVLCNIVGAFALACLYRYIIYATAKRGQKVHLEGIKLIFGVGLLGGFTTFSTISLDVYHITTQLNGALYAVLYLLITFLGGVLATAAGYMLTGKLIEGGQPHD